MSRKFPRWVLLVLLLWLIPVHAADSLPRIVVSSPGVRNLSFLPIELIPKIGADRAEGAVVQILGCSSGSLALQHLMQRNSDFAAAGLTAIMSHQTNDGKLAVLAAVNDLPTFKLVVRADLKKQVKSVADLKGKVLAANAGTLNSSSASWQTLEFLLRAEGVPLDSVRIVASSNSWEGQSSLLLAGAVDALMANEPFATRLLADKQVFTLVDLVSPEVRRRYPGSGYLHSALATRPDLLETESDKAARMVRILQRSLKWIATHSAEQIVAQMNPADPEERKALIAALKAYPDLYSKDGHFSNRQLQETELFFRKSLPDNAAGKTLRVDSLIVDKWVGRSD